MRLILSAAVILVLAACMPSTPDDRIRSTGRALPGPSEQGASEGFGAIELCAAENYRGLIGTNVGATRFPAGANLRVFGVNDIVTQDYIPQRTNIVFDGSRRIIRVYCG